MTSVDAFSGAVTDWLPWLPSDVPAVMSTSFPPASLSDSRRPAVSS
jgi:hypothetical protein